MRLMVMCDTGVIVEYGRRSSDRDFLMHHSQDRKYDNNRTEY